MTMDSNDSTPAEVDDVPQSLNLTIEQRRNIIKTYKQELVTLRTTMRAAESSQNAGQLQQGQQQ